MSKETHIVGAIYTPVGDYDESYDIVCIRAEETGYFYKTTPGMRSNSLNSHEAFLAAGYTVSNVKESLFDNLYKRMTQ